MDYKQPSAYHFSQDSIDLVNFVISKNHQPLSVLDLCSGCGIIGIDYTNKNKNVKNLYFIELQKELFQESLEFNIQNLLTAKAINSQKIFQDFKTVKLAQKFDLILCNPPYYPIESHRPSAEIHRSTCRLFEGDFFQKLFLFIQNNLSEAGSAYIVCRTEVLPKKLLEDWSTCISIINFSKKLDILILKN